MYNNIQQPSRVYHVRRSSGDLHSVYSGGGSPRSYYSTAPEMRAVYVAQPAPQPAMMYTTPTQGLYYPPASIPFVGRDIAAGTVRSIHLFLDVVFFTLLYDKFKDFIINIKSFSHSE
ncbi:hypothetical protein ABKN59_009921 [Abortiporus biennis]